MTPEQTASYVNSQAACALIEMQGMIAANQFRMQQGLTIAYDEKAFFALIDQYGISHNAVITQFSS